MGEHQQKIDEFVKVTGLDNQSIAALFLKNSSWNLQIALSAFYEYAADPTVIPSMSKADINFDSVNTPNEENGVVEQETLTSIMERRSEQLRRSQDDVTQNEEDGAEEEEEETIYRRPKDDVEPEETAKE